MHFVLSSDRIIELARALAAFRALSGGDDASAARSAVLDPLLDPERREIFDTAVRHAFARVVLRLIGDVRVGVLDAEDGSGPPKDIATLGYQPPMMTLDLETPEGLPEAASWAIRRALEEAIALLALASLAGASTLPSALLLAREWETKALAALTSVPSHLAPAPYVRV
ncbi:MAG: hypothetical protein K2F86_07495 [Duncaniella sp.]|nr:hypothetical protein [Duncaniella sp.]